MCSAGFETALVDAYGKIPAFEGEGALGFLGQGAQGFGQTIHETDGFLVAWLVGQSCQARGLS